MVRNYKRKTDRANISTEDLASAINEVIVYGRKIRNAAAMFNINKSTLHFHVKKKRSANEVDSGNESDNSVSAESPSTSKYSSRQVFTAGEEVELKAYLHKSSLMNFGLTYKHARILAFQYAKKLNKKYPATWDENQMSGIEWMRSFMKRHPKLSYRKPENVSIARTSGFNKANVELFFQNYSEVMVNYKFPPDRIVNTDETGISTVMQAPRVISETGKKRVGQCVSSERGTLVTFCGIITTTGITIPPLYVYPRVRMKDHYLYGNVPGAVGYATKSGWMSTAVFIKLLEHIHKHMHSTRENPVLLLVDNHETHVSLVAINYCREHGIVMLSFPPHCTHRMQLLDIGVYGPFKARCKSPFNDFILSNPGKAITIYDIASLTAQPYLLSFTPINITKAFEKAGIWPVNSLNFDDSDFAGVLTYGPSTSLQVENNPAPIIPSGDFEINAMNNSALTQTPEMPMKGDDSLEFITDLVEEVLTNVFSEASYLGVAQSPKRAKLVDIRPFPTLQPKQNRRGRKKGKSCIYTSTPEKNRVEADEKERNDKRVKVVKRKINDSEKLKPAQKKAKKRPKKKSSYSSSSESDVCATMSDCNSDSDIDLHSDQEAINGLLDDEEVLVGDFVLVKFATKRTVVHFVGRVEELVDEELTIKFLRYKLNSGFYYPTENDISTISRADIVAKLPIPLETKGTSRQASYIKFNTSFFPYNIK